MAENFSLSVLGAGATAPSAHGSASSYLVSGETGVILVDAGPGSLLTFYKEHALDELRGIVLTHLHADHSLDIMAWAYRWTFPDVLPRIPLYIPAGERHRLEAFDTLYGIPTLPTMVSPIDQAFDIREMAIDGDTRYEIDSTELVTFAARHAVTSASLRFERDGKSLVWSSDTGDCPGLRAAAAEADVFVSEATYLESNEETERAMAAHGHLTPRLAGEIATEVGVKHLVLTHFAHPGDGEASRERAAATFSGELSVAREGLTVTA
ncbi:MBL fold metallo-hydrolase [Corynebacterium uterequi]|uniref:Metal-dependent hydrolase, beta-lactamase superfamily III n=1 Tax=Corynebacterium uterequi TaxID=1072256 RepID=A0A0G3HCY2_9CORY|nr:MBL fold metallo-hydrolase [Corynebacterium uterequi]AKK11221.1 metal-dependent hydrolase, beta-lactamase superfamily III [Corynebacterium uterequi]